MRRSAIRGLWFAALGLALVALVDWVVYLPRASSAANAAQAGTSRLGQTNVSEFQARLVPIGQDSKASLVSITQVAETGTVDMATLGLHPLPAPLGPRTFSGGPGPDGVTIGRGNAYMGVAPDVVDQNTTSAFVTLLTNFTPAEIVNYSLNGGAPSAFAADAAGKLRINVNTGAGFGYITIEAVGVTSGKRAGGVAQVAPTGPYLVGVAVGPHSINPTGSSVVSIYGRGYPASSSVNLYRNGVLLGTSTTNAGGRVIVDVTVAATADTSAVYTVDNGTAGSMSGQTVEERSDAGTPPAGDQNITRAFFDRAVKDSATGATFSFVGEGFQPGETVTVSSCASGSVAANANGGFAAFLNVSAGAGVLACTLTGGTSGRVARASALAHANVTNVRGIIAAPSIVAPSGTVTVLLARLTPSDAGTFFLDGVAQGTATTSASGNVSVNITKPSTAFVHEVGWVSNTGGADAQAGALLLLAAPTVAPAAISGQITTPDGSPLGGTVMHLSGARSLTTVTDGSGHYHFDNVETDNFYTVTPSLANYHFSPASRSFSLVGNMTDAGFTANPDASQSANAIDMTEYFVRQQYLDFLGREPDQGGLDYWSAQINQCNGDANCIRNKRINVSAAFFASTEFQQTGSFIYGLYAGTLGRAPGYGEFVPDRAQVLGGSGLEEAKTAFAKSFVERPEFTSRYPQGMSREQFVDAVIQTMTQRSGVDQSALRDGFLSDYDSGGRALVVRHASEASSFVAPEYNKAFVLMEYFGYLRREIDQGGYAYWLDVLNNGTAGNYRGMVCAFLTSSEYQLRFSTVVTRSNAECGP